MNHAYNEWADKQIAHFPQGWTSKFSLQQLKSLREYVGDVWSFEIWCYITYYHGTQDTPPGIITLDPLPELAWIIENPEHPHTKGLKNAT
jgi:hypothetical protein